MLQHQDCSLCHGCLEKKRRKLPQVGGNTTSTPDADAAHVAEVQVADAAVQVQVDDEEYREQVVQHINIKAEVQAATAALKLVEDGFDAKDDLADSNYDCEYYLGKIAEYQANPQRIQMLTLLN